MPVATKSLENLKGRKPFQKGHPGMGGRPRTADLLEAMRQTYLGPGSTASRKRLLRVMERKCPHVIAHYLAGKPSEQIHVDSTVKAEVDMQEIVEAAARVRAELERQVKAANTGECLYR